MMRCSARVISPKPISTRPTRPAVDACFEVNRITPVTISKGDSHDRSNENTTAISAVPMSAPSMTASPAPVEISPCPTKEATIRQVAVLLCTRLVTARPAAMAVNRLSALRRNTRRRSSPMMRRMPVRTV